MEVKTLTLQRISTKVQNKGNPNEMEILVRFLNEKPILTNYLIEKQSTILGIQPFVSQMMNPPRGPSVVSFYEHISIPNLTLECKVTLTQEQVELIEELL